MRSDLRVLTLCMLALGYGAGCATETGDTGDDEYEVVADGKADNYYSNVATEYEVSGTIPVSMSAEDYANPARRDELVTKRLTAVGLFLTTYLTDKFRGIDENGDGQITEDEVFFRNDGYGGFHAMVRNQSIMASQVTGDAMAGVVASYTIDVAGPRNMIGLLPAVEGAMQTATSRTFEFKMPAGATSDPSFVNRREVRNFDPRTYTGAMETVRATIAPHAGISNAYPQFQEFFADGVFDLTLFYGHDYNTSRSDIREAHEAFDHLKYLGFTTPARSFDALNDQSGPFTKRIMANGKPVLVEVRIFHSNMFEGRRRVQHDLALSELVTRDVFFYPGHAGPYYAFYLDAHDEAIVRPAEITGAPFTSKSQLFVAQGCQTYSQYADMVYAHPAKDESNLDVVTTVNYSYGEGTLGLLDDLIRTDRQGRHQPTDYYRIVSNLNAAWINREKEVFYGVMGIEGNSQLHPYANVERLGAVCTSASQCGDTQGNACLAGSDRRKRCAPIALAPAACPSGTTYRAIARSGGIQGGACIR